MTGQTLTLAAADADDLETLSARLQDAVAKVKDLVWLPKSRRFAALFSRYKWEEGGRGAGARIRSGLHFDCVLSVKAARLRRDNPEAVVSLLAIRFLQKDASDPAGTVELVFSGGGVLRLEVECIAAELTDMAPDWPARGRPEHETEEG